MQERVLTTLFCLFSVFMVPAQSRLAVGQWQDHFATSEVRSLANAGDKIYIAFANGLVAYSLDDFSIEKIGRVQGLSDVGISTMAWDETTETLLIGYANGNIDLLRNRTIINVPDIINEGIIGSTAINEITLLGDGTAYFATDFGLVLLDAATGLSLDSYRFQTDEFQLAVNDVAILRDTIFAATNQGIWRAPFNDPAVLLADFRNWEQDQTVPSPVRDLAFNQIEVVGNRIFANYFSNEYPKDSLYYKDEGNAWERVASISFYQTDNIHQTGDQLTVARRFGVTTINLDLTQASDLPISRQFSQDQVYGLTDAVVYGSGEVMAGSDTYGALFLSSQGIYTPLEINAPYLDIAFRLGTSPDDALFVTAGGFDAQNSNIFRRGGLFRYHQGSWDNFHARLDTSVYNDTIVDFVEVAATSKDNFFIGSWGDGLLEFNNSQLEELYFSTNAPLTVREAFNSQVYSGYIQYDKDGNLWVSNGYSEDLFKVLTPAGEWIPVDLGNDYGGIAQSIVKEFVITADNQLWITRAGQGSGVNGLYAFQYGDDIADASAWQGRRFSENGGGIPNDAVLCVAEDLDGDIWIGTTQGPAVFYNPTAAIDDPSQQAQQIFIEQDGNVQIVLETEQINAIAIDGGNRKWFATQSSGIFLFSEDVTELIAHYTVENSPLLSNEVSDLAILPQSGELFIASGVGLQSLKIDATPGLQSISEINVYPNPVRPNYQGAVTMDGFVRDTQLKITDSSGRLVTEITSLGGRASWNLDRFDGGSVGSGIYLIMATSEDGEETIVDRVLVVRN